MDFRRIDQNTVQCILTEEEMNAYGFQVEDFFSNQEKSRDFLEHIVERAEEEVGYQAKGGMVSMQIMKMPNNDLCITFSEHDKEESVMNMLQHIQQLAGMLEGNRSLHSEAMQQDISDASETKTQPEMDEEYKKHMEQVLKRKQEKEKQDIIATRVYRFETLRSLEQFAASVELEKPITSTVYKDDIENVYYLLVKKGRLKLEEYKLLCERIAEFGVLSSKQTYVEQYCKEHFSVLIPKQAIRILKQIETGM